MTNPMLKDPTAVFVANDVVAEQWGVPRGTAFAHLEAQDPTGFAALKKMVGLQFDLERLGMEIEFSEDMPSTADTVFKLNRAFEMDDTEQRTEQVKRLLYQYGIEVLSAAIEQVKLKKRLEN